MRAAVCATLLLLALLHQGEALTCNYCKSRGGGLCTPTTTKSCSQFGACMAVVYPSRIRSSVRTCVNKIVCRAFSKIGTCCYTDLCN